MIKDQFLEIILRLFLQSDFNILLQATVLIIECIKIYA